MKGHPKDHGDGGPPDEQNIKIIQVVQYKFFMIPVVSYAEAEEELNKFLRSHRVH